MPIARVTITLHGRPTGSKDKPARYEQVRRTIQVPSPFTYGQARLAAFEAVQFPDDASGSPAYEVVRVKHILNVAFN